MSGVLKCCAVLGLCWVLLACASQPYQVAETKMHAVVSLPESVNLLLIDGKSPPAQWLNKNKRYLLSPGSHVLTFRYQDIFFDNQGEHEVVKSSSVALQFEAFAGSEYVLAAPTFKNKNQAKDFIKSPEFTLYKEGGIEVAKSVLIKSYAEASFLDALQSNNESPQQMQVSLTLLKQAWGRLSDDDKRAFKDWLGSQP